MIIKAWKEIPEKLDIDYVGKRGFRSSNTKVIFKCDECGREVETTAKTLVRTNSLEEQYCKTCNTKKTQMEKFGVDSVMHVPAYLTNYIKSRAKNLDEIVEQIESEGYKIIDGKIGYKNNRSPFVVQCPNGHNFKTTWGNWKNGYRCTICARKRISEDQKISFELIKSNIESEGYKLLTGHYKNNKQKLDLICPDGHECQINWASWNSRNGRCKICSIKKRADTQRYSIDFVRGVFESREYKLISEVYNGAFDKLEYICPKGHHGNITWFNFQQGHGCSSCPKNRANESKAEMEVFEFIKSYYPEAISRNRTLISPYELDIYIPSKGVAIEYCGLYFHSEGMGKDKNYHLNKLKRCQEQGVQLITIFEDEWLYKRDIVTSRLKSYLNISTDRVLYARNCEIREIDTRTKDLFLEENHLQGKDGSSVKLGAFCSDELVSVMTISKPNIAKGGSFEIGKYELNRFCSKINVRVAGIASKLLKHFKGNYESNEIYSYSDRRWSVGNLYEVLSFQFSHHSAPSYWYIIDTQRVHRFNFRKGVLESKLETFNPDLTEYENMANNGYRRIWDCGNTKWLYKKELI